MTIRRNMVVHQWGTPQRTVGSLNEPREREEHGIRFNEKWVYPSPIDEPSRPRERIIYWLRYDFVASYLVGSDGALVREDLAQFFAGSTDRQAVPDGCRCS